MLWNYKNHEVLKHLKAGNHMHSSDEETARQTKSFTKDSTSFTASRGGKISLTSDVFRKVSLDTYTCKQEQVRVFMAI